MIPINLFDVHPMIYRPRAIKMAHHNDNTPPLKQKEEEREVLNYFEIDPNNTTIIEE